MPAGFQDWPLVGRQAELDRIAAARSAAPAVVIGAPPGVGKSRLARHAVAAAEAEGAGTAWVQATRSAAAVPLGAFAGLIPPEARTDDPLELMQRSAAALRERGEDVVLGVDDAQLLDPTSAALVLHLAVTRAAFVVATVRTGEPCPDAVSALWKDAGAVRIDLRELTETETVELVERVLGGAAERRIGPWAYDGSRGNPLYVRELIAGALDEGALVDAHGLWRLTRRSAPSANLTELVTGRMAELSDHERRAVGLLALGEPLRLSEVAALTDAETLTRTEARGLVTVAGPGDDAEVRLAHPLYGEVVGASMPVTLAVRTRRELAGVVGARADRTREDALRIARWLLDAGDPLPPELLVDAAHAANASGDPELGARLASLALDNGAGIEAALLASRALVVRNRHAEAEELLSGWEGRIEDPGLAAGYLEQRTSVLVWGLERTPDALALVERAGGWWSDARWRRRVDALRLQLVSIDAGFTGMATVTEDVAADPGADPAAQRRIEVVHVANLFYGGRVREAHALLQAHLPPVPLRDELDEVAMVMACVIGLESGLGVADTTAWMAQSLTAAARRDDHAAAGIAASALGGFAFLAGRNREAARWFEESVAHSERHDPFHTATSSLAVLAGACYHLGDDEGAVAAMRRCRESIGDREQTDLDRAYIVRGEAWEALAEGETRRAQELLLEAAERLSESVPAYGGQLYHEALRAGVPATRVAGPLAALREACDAPLLAGYAERAAAGAAEDGVALRACADEFAGLGMLRYATECAAEAATVFAAAGRQDSARRAATYSRELHGKGQDGQPPEIRGLEAGEITLTAREAQLVELASRGLANAEIADRLVLSTRTVESHLYRAMQKLGVSDRRQLPERGRRS